MFDHIITLSLNPAIDATLWVEGIQTGADTPSSAKSTNPPARP